MIKSLTGFILCAVALMMGLSGSVFGEDRTLVAEFIGNEAFRLTDGTQTIMTDFPYQSGAYGYMEYTYQLPEGTENVASLITHRHLDHFDPLAFVDLDWSLIGPPELTVMMPQSRVIALGDDMHFGAAEITPIKAKHADVEHYTYLVNWQNKALFFTGDTEELAVLKALPALDALFITPWFYRKAFSNKALPETKKIIIYHHTANEIVPNCGECIIPVQGQVTLIE